MNSILTTIFYFMAYASLMALIFSRGEHGLTGVIIFGLLTVLLITYKSNYGRIRALLHRYKPMKKIRIFKLGGIPIVIQPKKNDVITKVTYDGKELEEVTLTNL